MEDLEDKGQYYLGSILTEFLYGLEEGRGL